MVLQNAVVHIVCRRVILQSCQASNFEERDRVSQGQQMVWLASRAQGHRPQHRRGQGRGGLRPEWQRQKHVDSLHQSARAHSIRRYHRRRPVSFRPQLERRQIAHQCRHGISIVQSLSAHDRAAQYHPGTGQSKKLSEDEAEKIASHFSNGSAFPTKPTSIRQIFPAASSSGSPSRARWR